MKLLVKTLKGVKFHVECEPSVKISDVKGLIVSRVIFYFSGAAVVG